VRSLRAIPIIDCTGKGLIHSENWWSDRGRGAMCWDLELHVHGYVRFKWFLILVLMIPELWLRRQSFSISRKCQLEWDDALGACPIQSTSVVLFLRHRKPQNLRMFVSSWPQRFVPLYRLVRKKVVTSKSEYASCLCCLYDDTKLVNGYATTKGDIVM